MELSEDEELWAEMRQFWSDDEEGGDLNRAHWKRLRRGQQRGSRGPGRAPRAVGAGRQRHTVITHYNAVTQVPFMLSRHTICGAQDSFNELAKVKQTPAIIESKSPQRMAPSPLCTNLVCIYWLKKWEVQIRALLASLHAMRVLDQDLPAHLMS